MSSAVIYLDNQATTPVDPRVVSVMQPYFAQEYGNPHSLGHAYGWAAEGAVEQARKNVAALIGADAREIIFTSGATESCNLALRGVLLAEEKKPGRAEEQARRKKIVTTAIEHPCVLETCVDLAEGGYEVAVIGVNSDGLVNMDEMRSAVDEQTLIVSVMAANNEIGTIQPIAEIGDICRAEGAYLHTDATQAVGKTAVDVRAWNVDLLSLSGHKLYGPKGVGALYVKWRSDVAIKPLVTGGGQERGLRSGTLPVPQIVGLGEACRIAEREIGKDAEAVRHLTSRLREILLDSCPGAALYGHLEKRVPGNISIGFPGFSGEEIVAAVSDRLAIATGAACSSVKVEPSHVLLALGIGVEAAQSVVRLSVGRFNTADDVERAADMLCGVVGEVRVKGVVGAG